MLKKAIYSLKALIHKNIRLYELVYNAITVNFDYLKQKVMLKKFPSKFGGMWTDRDDYKTIRADKLSKHAADDQTVKMLNEWQKTGRVIIRNAINHDLIDAYLQEIEQIKKEPNCPLLITASSLPKPTLYTQAGAQENTSVRIVDDYFYSVSSKNLLFHNSIINFISLAFDEDPILTQSLRFDYGSQQPIHQDTAFVRMNSPMKLAAVWIALEDIKPGTGELIYYPGSHHWEGYLFSGRFKHYDEQRDGSDELNNWYQWIHAEAKKRNIKAESFIAKKGDALIWHAALAHGGSTVTQADTTRLSLVGHYCPHGVRPLYHYYKPNQRKFYTYNNHQFTSSYYR